MALQFNPGEYTVVAIDAVLPDRDRMLYSARGVVFCSSQDFLNKEEPYVDVDGILLPLGTGDMRKQARINQDAREAGILVRRSNSVVSALDSIAEALPGRERGKPSQTQAKPPQPRAENTAPPSQVHLAEQAATALTLRQFVAVYDTDPSVTPTALADKLLPLAKSRWQTTTRNSIGTTISVLRRLRSSKPAQTQDPTAEVQGLKKEIARLEGLVAGLEALKVQHTAVLLENQALREELGTLQQTKKIIRSLRKVLLQVVDQLNELDPDN